MRDNYRSKFVSVVIQPKMETTQFWLSKPRYTEINEKLIEVSFPTPNRMPEAFKKIRNSQRTESKTLGLRNRNK